MTERAHDLGRGCWCAPIVLHVPPGGVGPTMVDTVRDADRLAALGITDVIVRPDVPQQRS